MLKLNKVFIVFLLVFGFVGNLFSQKLYINLEFIETNCENSTVTLRAQLASETLMRLDQMNVRFFVANTQLEFNSFVEVNPDYEFDNIDPLLGGANSAMVIMSVPGEVTYMNANYKSLSEPSSIPNLAIFPEFTDMFDIIFDVPDVVGLQNLFEFCPSVVWDKSEDCTAGLIPGPQGIQASASNGGAAFSVDEVVIHFNWDYSEPVLDRCFRGCVEAVTLYDFNVSQENCDENVFFDFETISEFDIAEFQILARLPGNDWAVISTQTAMADQGMGFQYSFSTPVNLFNQDVEFLLQAILTDGTIIEITTQTYFLSCDFIYDASSISADDPCADAITINWSSSIEGIHNGFRIDRMLSNEAAFTSINTVNPQGISATGHVYSYTDTPIGQSNLTATYRIYLIDASSNERLIAEETISLSCTSDIGLLSIESNECDENITFVWESMVEADVASFNIDILVDGAWMTIVQLNPTGVFPTGDMYEFNYSQEIATSESYRLSYTNLDGELIILNESDLSLECTIVTLDSIGIDQNECEELTLSFALIGTDKATSIRIDRSFDQMDWTNVSAETINSTEYNSSFVESILDGWNGNQIYYRIQVIGDGDEIIFEHIANHLIICVQQEFTIICPNIHEDFVKIKYSISTLEEDVNIYMFDMSGKLIEQLVKNDTQTQGQYERTFDISSLIPAQYILFVQKGAFQKGLKFQKF